jgi:lysophospholipase L1-like esterase
VTPDGACTVYVAPFGPGAAGPGSVAVIGDSLTGQLARSDGQMPPRAGPLANLGVLARRLQAAGYRTEIDGQSGRRWIRVPSTADAITQADESMLDELRGLRAAGSVVVALGTNDAGWAALAPTPAQYQLRMALVLGQLNAILDELREHGHCTVLVTAASQDKTYYGSIGARFDDAAGRIDALLRQRATGRLRLWDWAAQANPHGHDDAVAWFGNDTIHLNPVGVQAYAAALAQAAGRC